MLKKRYGRLQTRNTLGAKQGGSIGTLALMVMF